MNQPRYGIATLLKDLVLILLAVTAILLGTKYSVRQRNREEEIPARPRAAAGQLMTLSSDGKYLVNSIINKPVFIAGEDGWLLMEQISFEDAKVYLSNRATLGFNAVWLSPIDNVDQSNAPRNYYGNVPFDGPDFTNEDPAYWAYVDRVVKLADEYRITLVMDPAFVGIDSSGGYIDSYLNSSDATMTAYGAWLGNRYKNYDNIIWSLGGDANPAVEGLYQKIDDLGAGLASADPKHLITLEACRGGCTDNNGISTLQAYNGNPPSWMRLNWVYNTQPTVILGCQTAYTAAPTFLAPFMGEDWYELEHSMTGADTRTEGYWEVLSGCYLGRLFGNGPIWTFNSPHGGFGNGPSWQSQLSSEGSVAQSILGSLMRSREHWRLAPDINHTVVTSGYGSGLTITTTARTTDGQTIIAYIPNGNGTTLTVDMSNITSQTGRAKCWWFNPRNGQPARIGIFENTGSRNFTALDSNDWVLVIDDAATSLPPPGFGFQP